MTLYIVEYIDGSWANTGNYILGIFDNEDDAKRLVDRVEDMKDFNVLSGSGVRYYIMDLNETIPDEDIERLA